jgi:peroxiredoxin
MRSSRRDWLAAAALIGAAQPARGAQIPRPAPAFRFRMPGAGDTALDRFKGKVIGLEFFLTTCPNCQRASQTLQRMFAEYAPRGFQAVGVATNPKDDADAAALLDFYRRKFEIRFPLGWAPSPSVREFLQQPVMQTMYVPQLVFIDRTHAIRAQFGGRDTFFADEHNNMRAQIERLLGPARR